MGLTARMLFSTKLTPSVILISEPVQVGQVMTEAVVQVLLRPAFILLTYSSVHVWSHRQRPSSTLWHYSSLGVSMDVAIAAHKPNCP